MAAIVCQSYLESQLVEPRIRRLRLPSPKPLTPPPQPIDITFKSCFCDSNTKPHNYNTHKTDTTHNPNYNDEGGWTSIQTLSNNASKESSYVKSTVRLSPKSLELCTENLGNETGSDMIESESGLDLLSSSETTRDHKIRRTRQVSGAKEFPPPLTTIRGTESLRVSPHREGGRLVLEVTKINVPACFQAQRSHGRLRLSLWTHPLDDYDGDDGDIQGFQEELESEKTNGHVEDKEEEEEEEGVVEAENENGERGACLSIEDGVRIGKYEIERGSSRSRSRCKEGDSENNNNEMFKKKWGGTSSGVNFLKL